MTAHLNARDWEIVAKIYKALSEVGDAEAPGQWRHALKILEGFIGGEFGFVVVQERIAPSSPKLRGFRPTHMVYAQKLSATEEAFLADWLENESNFMDDLFYDHLMSDAGYKIRSRGHLDWYTAIDWDRSSVRLLLEGLGVEDRIVTVLPITDSLEVCYCLERTRGERGFTARDEAILEAVTAGLARPMHHFLSSRGLLPGQEALKEREQVVLELLLGPMVVKEIAEELDLSTYYVRDVIKTIYRKVGVRGRVELMARWFGPTRV